jgi:hypothetical protein
MRDPCAASARALTRHPCRRPLSSDAFNPSQRNPDMTRLSMPTPKPKSLTQQQSDFTAEGSPPPGKVAAAAPASTDSNGKAQPHPSGIPQDNRRRMPWGKRR